MGKHVDLTGQRFGRLTVLKQIETPPFMTGNSRWYQCRCDCGKVIDVRGNSLKQGQRSCGCLRDKNPIPAGQRFGRLVVLEKVAAPAGKNFERAWYKCRCDCGAVVVKAGHHLKSGGTKSCGCLQSENGTRNLSNWHKRQQNKED